MSPDKFKQLCHSALQARTLYSNPNSIEYYNELNNCFGIINNNFDVNAMNEAVFCIAIPRHLLCWDRISFDFTKVETFSRFAELYCDILFDSKANPIAAKVHKVMFIESESENLAELLAGYFPEYVG